MATTDANGLVILQDTDAVSPLHTAINTVTASVSNFLTVNKTIRYVANVTARTSLAGTYLPTTSNPLVVWRGDANTGSNIEYTTDGSNWFHVAGYGAGLDPRPLTAMGSVTITPSAANTPTSAAVTFPVGLFTATPVVLVNPATTVPGTTVTGWAANGVTTSGCNITLTRTSTVATSLTWVAVQSV